MTTQCPIVAATTKNCIAYQKTSADFARDARFYLLHKSLSAAANAQQKSREYHDAAHDRLSRLIGES